MRPRAVFQYARSDCLPLTVPTPSTASAVGLVKTTSSWKSTSTASMSWLFQASAHRTANDLASSGVMTPLRPANASHQDRSLVHSHRTTHPTGPTGLVRTTLDMIHSTVHGNRRCRKRKTD